MARDQKILIIKDFKLVQGVNQLACKWLLDQFWQKPGRINNFKTYNYDLAMTTCGLK